MTLIGKEKLEHCKKLYPKSSGNIDRWKKVIEGTNFSSSHEIKRTFPKSYDFVRPHCHVFDVVRNRYRIIALIDFPLKLVRIVEILDHAKYDKWKCT